MPPLLALAAIGAGLSACGDDDPEAQDVIDRAFSEPIESADATLDLELTLEGSDELSEPVRVQVSGPFRTGEEGVIPSFDFDVALQGGGAEVPPLGLTSTGENVFVDVQGVAYEVGEDVIADLNRQIAEGPEEQGETGLGALGVDPREWLEGAEVEEDVEVAGVATTHVSATVNVPTMVADLNEAAEQAEDVGAGPAPTLSEEERATLADAIEDATFDVFAGADDGTLRRLAAAVTFSVPEESQEEAGGVTGGSVSFSLELANVDGDQEIAAPEEARPLTDLFEQLGGLGDLLGGSEVPGAENGGALPGGGSGAPEGGGAAPGAGGAGADEAFREYSDCLSEADPSDQAALQACSELIAP